MGVPGWSLSGTGHWKFTLVDAVPVEAGINGAERAELVEDVFGAFVFESGNSHSFAMPERIHQSGWESP